MVGDVKKDLFYLAVLLGLFLVISYFVDPQRSLVVANILLVFLTALYVVLVGISVSVMEKARRAEFQPYISVKLKPLDPKFFVLELANVGRGPALNADAKIEFVSNAGFRETRPWKGSLWPSERVTVLLPDGDIDKLAKKGVKVKLEGVYKDIFGQEYRIYEEIDIGRYIDIARTLGLVYEEPIERVLKGIRDSLEEIQRILGERSKTAS